MSGLVVALAGRIGSGKTSISKALAEALQWPRVGFGDYLRLEAVRRGLDPTSRDTLQELGAKLVEQDEVGFCRAVLAHGNFSAGESLVIDGVRHVRVYEALCELVRPSTARLIYLTATDDERRARLLPGGLDAAALVQVEAHSTEADVKVMLPARADAVIDSNRAREAVLTELLEHLGRLGAEPQLVDAAKRRIRFETK